MCIYIYIYVCVCVCVCVCVWGGTQKNRNYFLNGLLGFVLLQRGTAMPKRCATNRKVAFSIPAGVIGIFY